MNYNGRASSQLNRVDSLRCAVAATQAFDKRTLRGLDIAEVILTMAEKFSNWLNQEPGFVPVHEMTPVLATEE